MARQGWAPTVHPRSYRKESSKKELSILGELQYSSSTRESVTTAVKNYTQQQQQYDLHTRPEVFRSLHSSSASLYMHAGGETLCLLGTQQGKRTVVPSDDALAHRVQQRALPRLTEADATPMMHPSTQFGNWLYLNADDMTEIHFRGTHAPKYDGDLWHTLNFICLICWSLPLPPHHAQPQQSHTPSPHNSSSSIVSYTFDDTHAQSEDGGHPGVPRHCRHPHRLIIRIPLAVGCAICGSRCIRVLVGGGGP